MACRLELHGLLISVGERIGVCGICGGAKRDLLRRLLEAPKVEVCNGLPGSDEPGRTGSAWVRRWWLSCSVRLGLGYSAAWSMLVQGSKGLRGVKGVRNPKYGVLLGAVGCVLGCCGWK